MFSPSRNEVRQFFCAVRQRQRDGLPLSGMELLAADIVAAHPEYHALLDHPEAALEREWTPKSGSMNPFLHLSLHLAIAEQLSIDQPVGIRALFTYLRQNMEEHAAQHLLLECLGEVLWIAQKEGASPDGGRYLAYIREAAARVGKRATPLFPSEQGC
ncbi:MAG: DUF1841 family protein [Zoogloeaceae bacterium]|jgi:hypothetical protein|nr:DUF1841 family protein [Zoogloeaceae bacterium]